MVADGIDEVVARASRVSPQSLRDSRIDAEAEAALTELLRLGQTDGRRLPVVLATRKRARRGLVAGVAAALIATTGAVAAGWVSAHSGVEVNDPRGLGTGEMIRLDGSDLDALLNRLARGIPFPSQASFERTETNIAQNQPTQAATSTLKSILSFNAACEWTGYWLDAYKSDDSVVMAEAQVVLDDIPSWELISGGGMRPYLELRAEGARDKNPSLFQNEYDINCGGGSVGSHGD